jgi:hypothetical protein
MSLGLMAYPDLKEKGDNSMPANRWSRPGVGAMRRGTRVIWRRLDCLNPNLQRCNSYAHRNNA